VNKLFDFTVAISRPLADWWRSLPKCFDRAAGVDLREWSVGQLDQLQMVYNQICDRVSRGSDSVGVGELVEQIYEELFVVTSVRDLMQINVGTGARPLSAAGPSKHAPRAGTISNKMSSADRLT
jgi:hypothetical protein